MSSWRCRRLWKLYPTLKSVEITSCIYMDAKRQNMWRMCVLRVCGVWLRGSVHAFLFLCVYPCMRECICACVSFICVSMCGCMCMYANVHKHGFGCTYVSVYARVKHVWMHACMHILHLVCIEWSASMYLSICVCVCLWCTSRGIRCIPLTDRHTPGVVSKSSKTLSYTPAWGCCQTLVDLKNENSKLYLSQWTAGCHVAICRIIANWTWTSIGSQA